MSARRRRVGQPVVGLNPPDRRVRQIVTNLVGAVLLGVFVVGCSTSSTPEGAPALRVAAGPEPESQLLARTIVLLLDEAGIPASPLGFADGRSARQAVELGDAELLVAYSGEEWLTRLGRPNPPADPREALEALLVADRDRGLTWLVPSFGSGIEDPPANATFAFFAAGPPSVHADLRSLSELSLRLAERPELSLCVDTEFGRREDGLAALLSAYSVRRDRPFLAADPGDAVRRVLDGDCVAGLSDATDGRAWSGGMVPLADDLRFFPALVPAPVVRSETLSAMPEIRAALQPLLDGLSTGRLGRANGAVVRGANLDSVAGELARSLLREDVESSG